MNGSGFQVAIKATGGDVESVAGVVGAWLGVGPIAPKHGVAENSFHIETDQYEFYGYELHKPAPDVVIEGSLAGDEDSIRARLHDLLGRSRAAGVSMTIQLTRIDVNGAALSDEITLN